MRGLGRRGLLEEEGALLSTPVGRGHGEISAAACRERAYSGVPTGAEPGRLCVVCARRDRRAEDVARAGCVLLSLLAVSLPHSLGVLTVAAAAVAAVSGAGAPVLCHECVTRGL